jgi:putative endonuclease
MIRALLARLTGRSRAAGGERRARGNRGEDLAVAEIRRAGGKVVARNWKCRLGELDLVIWERRALAFVEVKSRARDEHGRPSDNVTRAKRRRIERLAVAFCKSRRLDPETRRFDVIEVIWSEPPAVEWTRDAWLTGD